MAAINSIPQLSSSSKGKNKLRDLDRHPRNPSKKFEKALGRIIFNVPVNTYRANSRSNKPFQRNKRYNRPSTSSSRNNPVSNKNIQLRNNNNIPFNRNVSNKRDSRIKKGKKSRSNNSEMGKRYTKGEVQVKRERMKKLVDEGDENFKKAVQDDRACYVCCYNQKHKLEITTINEMKCLDCSSSETCKIGIVCLCCIRTKKSPILMKNTATHFASATHIKNSNGPIISERVLLGVANIQTSRENNLLRDELQQTKKEHNIVQKENENLKKRLKDKNPLLLKDFETQREIEERNEGYESCPDDLN